MSDWEYSDESCPKCQSELATRVCEGCGGEGVVEDVDGDWCAEVRCDTCNGKRHETWCRECGWDVNYNHFLSPEYERVWLEKQGASKQAG